MLAIIIPYYKITFFEATLKSLATQIDQRFTVYIGDDASPENPLFLLDKYKDKFEFIYQRFETNLGGSSLKQQWERCINLSANEEWIMILGDDDVLGEHVIKDFYESLLEIKKEESNIIRFATQFVDEKENTISEVYQHSKLEMAADSFVRRMKGLTRSSLSEYIFSRDSYSKYKFREYPLGWHSDDMAWLDFTDNKPIFTINSSTIFIRMSNLNISGKSDNKILKNLALNLFYKDLIKDKLNLFQKKERYKLLMKYEQIIKRTSEPTTKEWGLLLKAYSLNFNFVHFAKLLRRIFISYSSIKSLVK
ncbi:glycosyltransferase family 2 protein [Flavobacterium aquidurense]|uniref:glycosyltransferase family 2 protein n=1 Tax=Flavobacterium aquidurense TaxID=362413 RepID=UPI00285DC628|nr:glycosyltransferase family 2 protein [Flavobacterium aquidurense]MDR7372328.1 hypothetical protein [Flavobacterium aquidurense]